MLLLLVQCFAALRWGYAPVDVVAAIVFAQPCVVIVFGLVRLLQAVFGGPLAAIAVHRRGFLCGVSRARARLARSVAGFVLRACSRRPVL